MNDSLGVIFFMLALVAGGIWTGWLATYGQAERELIRDCSLTGTHIIDNDTVVVCQVLSRTTTSTPQPQSKKPEISL